MAVDVQARRVTDAVPPPRAATPPIVWWAAIGGFSLLCATYLWGRWIFSDKFVRVPIGRSDIPGWMAVAAQAHDIASVVLTVLVIWWFIWRPWRRDGHLSFDGLFVLAIETTYWLDIIQNYGKVSVLYNSALFNRGSWYQFIPGWMVPNSQNIVESPFFAGLSFFWIEFLPLLAACWFMKKAQARWPHMGKLGLAAVCFAFLALIELACEPPWALLGIYTWPNAIEGFTIFKDHYYQFPLYETLVWTACWTAMACVRYFKNDKGETLVERGLGRLKATGKKRTFIRFLALAGAMNLFTFGYEATMAFISLNGDPWPQDIVKRSYFTNNLCGPGTGYACPVEGAPIPVRGSAYINERGELVDPSGRLGQLKEGP